MTEIDISRRIFSLDGERDIVYGTMLEWIYENIGEETASYGMIQPVVREGHGWKIISKKELSRMSKKSKSFNVIRWYICIDDEQLATLFALKWIG